jgi:hypothetical protein
MHTLGKVLVWLVVLGWIGALALTVKMLDVRNSWTQKLDGLKARNVQNAEQIAQKQAELDNLRSELAQTMLGWDKAWSNIPVIPNQDGTLTAQIGTNDGFGLPATAEPPVAYLFVTNPADGTSQYVGSFQAAAVRENQAAFRPTFRIRGNEPQQWQASGNWRVRAMIPPGFMERFSDLHGSLTLGDQALAGKQQHLQIQQELVEVSKQHLTHRQEELLGYKTPPPGADRLSEEWTVGLVAAIANEEDRRNEELTELDRLRREVKDAFAQRRTLIEQNAALVRSLPGADSTPATTPVVSSK